MVGDEKLQKIDGTTRIQGFPSQKGLFYSSSLYSKEISFRVSNYFI
jgi:hypothetical protein